MTELEKVIKSFEEQIASGYTCVDKKSKYAYDIDHNHPDWYNGNKYGFDWCTVFFDWNFINALGEDRARKVLNRPKDSMGAGVRYSREYLKSIGRVGDEPKVGCAIYFGDLPYPRHIGFVYKVTASMVYTYEGNCYVSKGVSGVKAKSYKRTNSDILDYGYPVYDESPDPGPKELDGYKVGETYEVKYDALTVRKGPGTNYEAIGSLDKGSTVVCLALSKDSSNRTWMQHKTGWSCAHEGDKRYIDTVGQKTGWIKTDGKWYYYDPEGNLVVSAWQLYKGDWYYLGSDGAMLTGWQTIGSATYYFYPNDDGHMASEEWVDGLFIDATGKQTYKKKGSWKSNSSGKWFVDEYGWYPKNRTIRIDRTDYEFDKNGYVIVK